jgi:hypothetical protein
MAGVPIAPRERLVIEPAKDSRRQARVRSRSLFWPHQPLTRHQLVERCATASVGAARLAHRSVWFSALWKGQEALVACVPRASEACMAIPPLPDDPGVLAGSAHDLPGADADLVVVSDIDPLVPVANREGS